MLQISSGLIKGLQLQSPSGDQTRPSGQRLRQAIFNVLRNYRKNADADSSSILDDASVADVFAGSGALGFEAASNGASRLLFIESSKQTLRALQANLEKVHRAFEKQSQHIQLDLLAGPIESNYGRLPPGIDIVFADPPYRMEWDQGIAELEQKYQRLRLGGLMVFESAADEQVWSPELQKKASLRLFDQKIYGDSSVYYLIKEQL